METLATLSSLLRTQWALENELSENPPDMGQLETDIVFQNNALSDLETCDEQLDHWCAVDDIDNDTRDNERAKSMAHHLRVLRIRDKAACPVDTARRPVTLAPTHSYVNQPSAHPGPTLTQVELCKINSWKEYWKNKFSYFSSQKDLSHINEIKIRLVDDRRSQSQIDDITDILSHVKPALRKEATSILRRGDGKRDKNTTQITIF